MSRKMHYKRLVWSMSIIATLGVIVVMLIVAYVVSGQSIERLRERSKASERALVRFSGYEGEFVDKLVRIDPDQIERVMNDLHITGRLERRWISLPMSATPSIEVWFEDGAGRDPLLIEILMNKLLVCRLDGVEYYAYLSDRQVIDRLFCEAERASEDAGEKQDGQNG